jgi:arginine repressor
VTATHRLAPTTKAARQSAIAELVAGDDTVLVICRDERAARATASALLALAEG